MIDFIIETMPGKTGMLIRRLVLSRRFKRCGKGIRLNRSIRITGHSSIEWGESCGVDRFSYILSHNGGILCFGNRVNIAANVHISAADSGRITMGDDVIIGPNVVIRASKHRYEKRDVPIRWQGHEPGEIVIGPDVWIGANVVVLPGARIEKGAIIGAGSVVTGNIPGFSIAVGAPARVVKVR